MTQAETTKHLRTRLKNALAKKLKASPDEPEESLVRKAAGQWSSSQLVVLKGIGQNTIRYMAQVLNTWGYNGDAWYHGEELEKRDA